MTAVTVDRALLERALKWIEHSEPLSNQDIYDVAHRKATRFTHTAKASEVMYGFSESHIIDFARALYASPAPVKPLTVERIKAIYQQYGTGRKDGFEAAVRAVESAHGIKEQG